MSSLLEISMSSRFVWAIWILFVRPAGSLGKGGDDAEKC